MPTSFPNTAFITAQDLLSRAASQVVGLRRRAHDHLLALSNQAVVSGASFFATIVISRFSDAAHLGTFAIIISILSTAYTVQGQLISLPYSIQRHKAGNDARAHAGSSLVFSFCLSALLALLTLLVGLAILVFGETRSELLPTVWILAAVLPFAVARDFFRRFSFAHLMLADAFRLDRVASIVQVALLCWLAWSGAMSATTACVALGLSCAIGAAEGFFSASAQFAFRARAIGQDLLGMWKLGK